MQCFNLGFTKMVNIHMIFIAMIFGHLTLAFPCNGSTGKYLVASQAAGNKDFDLAAKNYLSILDKDNSDTLVLQEALIFSVLANNLNAAWRLSTIVEQKDFLIPSAGLVALAKSSMDKDFEQVKGLVTKYEKSLPKFLISFAHGWSEIANGNFEGGIKNFTKLDGTISYLADYNSSLAYAMKSDFINSMFYLNKLEGKMLQFDELQLKAQAQIYSNNGENGKAIVLLEANNQRQNNNLFQKELRVLKSGNILEFDAFKTPSDALASVFYLMGSTRDEKTSTSIASIFYIHIFQQ